MLVDGGVLGLVVVGDEVMIEFDEEILFGNDVGFVDEELFVMIVDFVEVVMEGWWMVEVELFFKMDVVVFLGEYIFVFIFLLFE